MDTADTARTTNAETRVGIIGSGVIGLTSALTLVEAGYRVSIVAKNLPGDFSSDWSSPWAGALLAPYPDASTKSLQAESLRRWHLLCQNRPECGLREINIEEYYDDGKDDSKIWYRSIYPDMKLIHPEELDPDVSLGLSYRGLVVDPNVFLPWAFTTLQNMGVDFVRQEVIDFRHAKEITGAEILVNASGLGARRLGPDPNVHGVRGQTIFVNCTTNDEQCYKRAVIRQGSQYTYAIPRQSSRGIVLGGVSEQHNVSPEVDPSTRLDIMKRVNRMTKGMFDWVNLEKDIRLDIVGFRPARHGGMRLEREGDVIHAYGVGGLGYLYAFGVAEQVKLLATGGKIPVKL